MGCGAVSGDPQTPTWKSTCTRVTTVVVALALAALAIVAGVLLQTQWLTITGGALAPLALIGLCRCTKPLPPPERDTTAIDELRKEHEGLKRVLADATAMAVQVRQAAQEKQGIKDLRTQESDPKIGLVSELNSALTIIGELPGAD